MVGVKGFEPSTPTSRKFLDQAWLAASRSWAWRSGFLMGGCAHERRREGNRMIRAVERVECLPVFDRKPRVYTSGHGVAACLARRR
jgi:hypothetical protein